VVSKSIVKVVKDAVRELKAAGWIAEPISKISYGKPYYRLPKSESRSRACFTSLNAGHDHVLIVAITTDTSRGRFVIVGAVLKKNGKKWDLGHQTEPIPHWRVERGIDFQKLYECRPEDR